MVRVPPFDFPLENRLIPKLNLMIQRCVRNNPKRDAVLLIEGAEGEGKTNFSVAIAYYIKQQTGRTFDHTHIFFDLNEMLEFLKTTDSQIAIWDEPALQAMSKDSLTTLVKNLERLLMMARKKRHFLIINIAYFNKFSEYIVWQRPLAMLHVYSQNEIIPGRFVYIRKKNLEKLWYDWKFKKKRNYKKYAQKGIRGGFPNVLNLDYKHNVCSVFNVAEYEKKKDKAIMMIGEKPEKKIDKSKIELRRFKKIVASIPRNLLNRGELAKALGVDRWTLNSWLKFNEYDDKIGENPKENEFEGVRE